MNIKKILTLTLTSALAATLLIVLIPSPNANASTSIPFQDENGRKVVPIKTLCEIMNGKVTTIAENGLTIYEINGKAVYIYDKSYCAFIDGNPVAYETEELTDTVDGHKFNWPTSYKPTKSAADEYLVPVDFLKTYTGIKNEGDAFVVLTKEEVTNNNNGNVIVIEKPSGNESSGGTQNQGGGSSGGTQSQGGNSAPVTPTPTTPTPTTPTPEPPQTATGISGAELNNRMAGQPGFVKTSYGGWSYGKDGISYGEIGYSGGTFELNLYNINAQFASTVSQALNWILPTKGSWVYNRVQQSGNYSGTLDGRQVQINDHGGEGSIIRITG